MLYSATLYAIVLQTRCIIDTMNSKGHHISSIYKWWTGEECVVDAANGGWGLCYLKGKGGAIDPVVLGAATSMLGRYADEASAAGVKGR